MTFKTHNQYQRAEVDWYRAHGQYAARIVEDKNGDPYVIGDFSWNSKKGSHIEFIDRRMAAALAEPADQTDQEQ